MSPPTPSSKRDLFIGLMTGTSLDGADGVLADFSDGSKPRILSHASLPMPPELQRRLLALNSPGSNELDKAARASLELARLYAQTCQQLLHQTQLKPADIRAIGAHGQTVRHAPDHSYTIQINASALLAELSDIDVIADFRSRDVAAGGQGAPLTPAFHQVVFASSQPRAIVNLGGMANVTLLDPQAPIRGFDTGPANVLLDLWCQEKTGKPYDENGQWAATGNSNSLLLKALLDEPWFDLPPPKSTGRELFNRTWLDKRLQAVQPPGLKEEDIQASLQSLTAITVVQAITAYAPHCQDLVLCGGGAQNRGLRTEIEQRIGLPVKTSDELGLPAQQVEALAFAWLARAHVRRETIDVANVTGASGNRILGCCYPA